MPLEPETLALLDELSGLGLPLFESLPPEQARAVFNAAFQTPPESKEPVDRVEDRTVPGPGGAIPVRLYAPRADAPLPLLVFYHGGGWVLLNLDTHDGLCRKLANAVGCAVVSVDYRLAPEHPFPAAAEDAHAAARWLADHAGELGLDPARVAVAGDSAGGNLATVTALMARDRGGPALRAQALIYPVTDASMSHPSVKENAEGYLLTRDGMEYFWGHYLNSPEDGSNPYASPLAAPDLSGLPPALVITAEYDPLRDEGERYADRLREAGVQARLSRYAGTIHGFALLSDRLSLGRQAIAEVSQFLREQLAA